MPMIYVVFGSTGEYSDRSEWPVTAYVREEDAKQHVEKATEYSNAWLARTHDDDWYDLDYSERERQRKDSNPMDPQFSCDYTGTTYWHAPIELRDAFTAPEAVN